MKAWQEDMKIDGSIIKFYADPLSEFTQAMELNLVHKGPMSIFGAKRCKRFAMLVDDGVIKKINVAASKDDPAGDDNPEAAMAEKMIEDMDNMNKPKPPKAKIGDAIPDVELDKGWPIEKVKLKELCAGKKVILVGLPGAFTGT